MDEIFQNVNVKKPIEVRMGKGKGSLILCL